MEYVNISGLRLDGRRPPEVRRIRSQMGVFPRTDGSALLEMGGTKVIAVVHGPREAAHRGSTEHDAAVLECDFRCEPRLSPRYGRLSRASYYSRQLTSWSLSACISTHTHPWPG